MSLTEAALQTPRRPLLIAACLLALEFLMIGLVFKHGVDFPCRANWPHMACNIGSRGLAGLYCVLAALALFFLLRPGVFHRLLSAAGHDGRPLLLNGAGAGLAMIPVLFLRNGQGTAMLLPAFACWTGGMALMLAGLVLYLAPPGHWRRFLAEAGGSLALVVATGAAAPALAMQLQPIWRLDAISDATFRAVTGLIGLLGYQVMTEPGRKVIGSDTFSISVAPVCSGIEGIALVTLFASLYLWLFRHELRFPRALLLYPLGIAASAVLNVVRITLLLVLGIEGQPELAVGGFHSHAGWVMFTLVAMGIILVARTIPSLHRAPAATASLASLPPLHRDPAAAQILPFAVFMLTAVAVPAISQSPAMLYPIRVLVLGLAVGLFWPFYRRLPWRLDRGQAARAILAGLAIGLFWVAVPVPPSGAALPYGSLSGGMILLWFVFRGIGTVILVPLVEELFFRLYLEGTLRGSAPDRPAPAWRAVLAALVTAGLFAALHDRWAEAFVAGLILSWVVRRTGRITAGILAHALANAIVFGAAILTGNLHII